MPKRGSVKVLLLSLRPRATLGWGLGGAAAILLLGSVVHLKEEFPLLEKTGLAQALRQSVWEQALAGQSTVEHWPWQDLSVNMSLLPAAKVPRLGLSASMLKQDATDVPGRPTPHRAATASADEEAVQGDVAIGDVAIGDNITVTAADGATCVYRVTGHRVVDPHLAESEAERADGAASPFSCGPIDRLITQATQGEPPAAPPAPADQQKL